MATVSKDPVADVERHRLRLEENVSKLKGAFNHWKAWETEYQALQDEIRSLPVNATGDEMVELSEVLRGHLVNEKEIKDLVGYGKSIERTREQVGDMISRRLDYVRRNIDSMQKQLDVIESEHGHDYIYDKVNLQGEEDLPMTEIYEELDDDGNVTASRITHPDRAQPEILEALKKAGIQDTDVLVSAQAGAATNIINERTKPNEKLKRASARDPKNRLDQNATPDLRDHMESNTPRKKSVTFAEGTKEAPAEIISSNIAIGIENNRLQDLSPPTVSNLQSKALPEVQEITPSHHPADAPLGSSALEAFRQSLVPRERIVELDENDNVVTTRKPIMESAEDATLRRQMLQYSMSEVGSIVAQLDLEESGSQASDSEDLGTTETDDVSISSAEEEDSHGVSAKRGLSEQIRKQMSELDAKLGTYAFQNVGPQPNVKSSKDHENIAHASSSSQNGVTAKSVRFAENLDYAPPPSRLPSGKQNTPASPSPSQPLVTAIKDNIVERRPTTASQSIQPRKVSRFKNDRAANSSTSIPQLSFPTSVATASEPATTHPTLIPTPETRGEATPQDTLGQIFAKNIIERTPSTSNTTPAESISEPDEFDPAILQQQLAAEYHYRRERLIEKQGGFLRQDKQEEQAEIPLDDEGDDRPARKISLFKAARLQGGDRCGW